MRTFSITFKAVSVSAQSDLFELVNPSAGIIEILSLSLGQTSDMGDAAAESLPIALTRGYSVSGSGGSSATPAAANSLNAGLSAATAEVNNTTVANTSSVVDLLTDTWNIQAGYLKVWTPEERITLRNGERIVLRQGAPADAITQHGTLTYLER